MLSCKVLFLLLLISLGNSAKILSIFPLPSKSHHILGSALLKELAKRGHEVTMISTFPLENPPDRYHDVNLIGLLEEKEKMFTANETLSNSMIDKAVNTMNAVKLMSRNFLANPNMQKFIKSGQQFDICIQMWGYMQESLLGVGHAVNATTIGFSLIGTGSFLNYHSGNPTPYAYVPDFHLSYTDDMSFWQRLSNTCVNIALNLIMYFVGLPYQRELLKEFFPNAPSIEELVDGVDLVLMNSHYSTETPRPYTPNLIQIGGFHIQEPQVLDDNIKRYLDNSKGVVYFSLGSNMKSSQLPTEMLDEILAAFGKLNYDVLWKFEAVLLNKPKNVKIEKWLPQRAVLDHPNVKAFITHGGLGSTVEAIYYGVPMVGIPLFGDQEKNIADGVNRGYSIRLGKENLKETPIIQAINEIITNPVYTENIKLRSDLFRNQEMSPMDKAVFWVEHVIKHKGAKHLKPKSIKLPFYQYMLLDVITFLSIIVFTTVFLLYKLFSCCCERRKVQKLKLN